MFAPNHMHGTIKILSIIHIFFIQNIHVVEHMQNMMTLNSWQSQQKAPKQTMLQIVHLHSSGS